MPKVTLPVGTKYEQALAIRDKVSWSRYPLLYVECVLTSDHKHRERYYISVPGYSWLTEKTLKKWVDDFIYRMGMNGVCQIRRE